MEGADISGKGEVSHPSSDKRTGDLLFLASNLDPAFFASFYPPVSDYRLKGELSLTAGVKGLLSRPTVHISLNSRNLSLMENYSIRNLKAETDITDLKAGLPSDLRLDVGADSATVAGASVRR